MKQRGSFANQQNPQQTDPGSNGLPCRLAVNQYSQQADSEQQNSQISKPGQRQKIPWIIHGRFTSRVSE